MLERKYQHRAILARRVCDYGTGKHVPLDQTTTSDVDFIVTRMIFPLKKEIGIELAVEWLEARTVSTRPKELCMTDKTRETKTSEYVSTSAGPPSQIIEDLIEILRRKDTLSGSAETQFSQSAGFLDQCIALRENHHVYTDAVQRSPWLTSDVEHLKRRWTALRQSLYTLCMRARRGESPHGTLIHLFNGFAERFLECQADEQCLLEAAFPAPTWTDDSPGSDFF